MIRTRYFILTHHTKSQTLPSMPLKLFRSRNVLSMYCSKLRWDASSIMHHFKWPSCGIGQSRQASISTNWIIWSDIWSYLKIDEKISISLVWPRKQLSEIWDSAWIFKQCLAARNSLDPDYSPVGSSMYFFPSSENVDQMVDSSQTTACPTHGSKLGNNSFGLFHIILIRSD